MQAEGARAGWALYGPVPPADLFSVSSLVWLCFRSFDPGSVCLIFAFFIDVSLMCGVCVRATPFRMVLAHLPDSLWDYEHVY